MNTQPFLSCIIPVYNMERHLKRCLDSCLAQLWKDFELILVDDGATDSSPQICDEYAQKDERIHVVHQKNAGVGAAKNAGMALASGKYLVFIDSDDFVDADYFAILAKSALEKDYDMIFGGVRFVQESNMRAYGQTEYTTQGEVQKAQFPLVLADMINDEAVNFHVAKLYKTKLVKENGIAFTDFRETGGDDTVFIMDVLCVAESIFFVNKAIYNYIIYNKSTSHSYTGDRWQRGLRLDALLTQRCIQICEGVTSKAVQQALDHRVVLLGLWSCQEISRLPVNNDQKIPLIGEIIENIRFQQACNGDPKVFQSKSLVALAEKNPTAFLLQEKRNSRNVKGIIYKSTPKFLIYIYIYIRKLWRRNN